MKFQEFWTKVEASPISCCLYRALSNSHFQPRLFSAKTFITLALDAREDVPDPARNSLSTIDSRLSTLESGLHELRQDLPPSFSRNLLRLQRDINLLLERMTPLSNVPATDPTQRITALAETLISGQNEIGEVKLLFPSDDVPESAPEQVLASLESVRDHLTECDDLTDARVSAAQASALHLLVHARVPVGPSPALLGWLVSQIDLQQREIRTLMLQIARLPDEVAATLQLIVRFAELRRKTRQPEIERAEQRRPDLTGRLAELIGDVEAFAAEANAQIEGIARRDGALGEKCEKCEKCENGEKIEDEFVALSNGIGEQLDELEDGGFAEPLAEVRMKARDGIADVRKQIWELQVELQGLGRTVVKSKWLKIARRLL
jgi:hypothetical protein